MINVTAPTRLMFVSNCSINAGDLVRYFCLPLEGESRLVDNNLFIDDPDMKAHEHYLVHGKMSGGITSGCEGLTNPSGLTIQEVYKKPGVIVATDCVVSGKPFGDTDPYGKPYPDDTMTYYCVIHQQGDASFALVYWINYQANPQYADAPYWVQCSPRYCVKPHKKYSTSYEFYEPLNCVPKETFYKSLAAAKSAIRSNLEKLKVGRYISGFSRDSSYVYSGENTFSVTEYDAQRLPSIRNLFKYQEYDWVPKRMSNHLFGDSYSFQHLRQSAFWDAISDLKVLNQNSLQTIVEALQFLKKVKTGKFRFDTIIPDSLSDLWLRYRYQYSTSKSDVKEALDFIQWTGVFDCKDTFFVRGVCSYNDQKCICKVTVKNRFLTLAKQCWTNLYKYGLQPNYYVVWDFTPFSFIVDWFLPVGDLCAIIDQYNYLFDRYDCVNVVYSLKYGATLASGGVSLDTELYSRWVENHFPPCEFCYLYDGGNSSDKTILFRCIDAASLILGRK